LLAIFGAGASYDSVDLSLAPGLEFSVTHETMYRPPLARELFDERPDFLDAMNRWRKSRCSFRGFALPPKATV
jgi:hypothetical protein